MTLGAVDYHWPFPFRSEELRKSGVLFFKDFVESALDNVTFQSPEQWAPLMLNLILFSFL
jgi:hypothetical protein